MEAGSVDLDYGRSTRNIPPSLDAALVIRDEVCRFPGCVRTADLCEVHHVDWWDHGGGTAPDNTVIMCVRHHHELHEPGWHAKLLPDAEFRVTKPDGTELVSAPRYGEFRIGVDSWLIEGGSR
ncbi:MAG: HNH endonuclease signature motif containing protein [Acidimicrobiia bacterium]